MRKLDEALMSFAVMAGSALFASTAADAYSSKVKDACAGDYQNFCAQYMPDSTELRRCFDRTITGKNARSEDISYFVKLVLPPRGVRLGRHLGETPARPIALILH